MRKRNMVFVSLVIALVALSVYSLTPPIPTTDYGLSMGLEIHVDMYHWRDGVLLSHSHHAGVLTNLGANWTKDQMGGLTWNGSR